MPGLRRYLHIGLATTLLAGCAAAQRSGGDPDPPVVESSSPAPTTASPPAAPRFSALIRPLSAGERAEMTGVSWHPGCPVPLTDLRWVSLSYRDFAGAHRQGALVVAKEVAPEVVRIFRRLYRLRFPIRRMRPIEAYDGDDFASIEADNTSAYNCRTCTGSTEWSHHAYGIAIDINPLENPYVYGGRTAHPRSVPYLDRARVRPGMILADGPVHRVFLAQGWHWGGDWAEPLDYQHFSARVQRW